jgi:hypothetical protein
VVAKLGPTVRRDVRCGDFCGRDIRNTRGGSGKNCYPEAQFYIDFSLASDE